MTSNELFRNAAAAFQFRPPLAEAYIDRAYEQEPDNPAIRLFRLKVKIYTQPNNDVLFQEELTKEAENEEYFQHLIKVYYEYLLFNNRFSDIKEAFNIYFKYHDRDIEFQLYTLYVKYIETLNVGTFKDLKGFSNQYKELFFNFFTNFPLYSKDIKPFTKILRRFFSNKIITLYKTFTAVQTDSFYYKKYDESFPDLSFKYILEGDIQKGWQKKILNTLHVVQNPEYYDMAKCVFNKPLKNKTILISTEQGFGDNIIYYRMWNKLFHSLAESGTNFIYCVNENLYELFKENLDASNVKIYKLKEEFEQYKTLSYDYYYPDFTAPLILKLKNNNLKEYKKLKVNSPIDLEKSIGLFWYTEIRQNFVKHKTLPLDLVYNKLNLEQFQKEGYTLYSLQQYHTPEDLELMNTLGIKDISDKLDSFYSTTKYMQNMNKVYSIDTSILHLSKALDLDTTVMLNYFKGYHYNKKGLYPDINKIDLEYDYYKYLSEKIKEA